MSLPQDPFKNRQIRYTSVPAAVAFNPPIAWVAARSSGNIVLKDEAGNAVTIANCAGGEVYSGPYSEITSMTCTDVMLGDGDPPTVPVATAEASAATSLTASISANLSALTSADTSLYSRLSTTASANLSAGVSADTSLFSRVSTTASANLSTALSAAVSAT